ncbi:hypothetical protein [Arthrobacter alpinus]|uniref:hypothetical protein n=1 Tax=Arthrobacter alpinus TaxID=656366 RepID=UPI0018D13F11|nr:hypothetical protein [Arthrobacter alpinus]
MDASHPMGCRATFVGDLVDRGLDSPGVLRLVTGLGGNAHAHAYAVPGDHEDKLVCALKVKKVTMGYGLPVRLPWAEDYRGKATVLYGHSPTWRRNG